MSTYSTLYDELTDIITTHILEISKYVPTLNHMAEKAPEQLLASIDQLAEIIQIPAYLVSYELYREACEYQDSLTAFLRVMNQPISHDYSEATSVGQILAQTDMWRKLVINELKLTNQDVWEMIAPAIPDHLANLGDGQYEARWWMPVPVMDIEILKRTEGVFHCSEPFEPEGLIGGLALRFSVIE